MSAFDPDICPRCGTPLPLDPPRVCTRCALADVQAFATEESASEIPEEMDDYAPGALIGKYKLLEPIGEGGFGVVFLAEDQDLGSRQVALKIIKLGMDTKQVMSRFEVERQALVKMHHSNIAMVLDAGTTTTGRPYFVVELVRGKKISEYCDNRRLTIPKRLELFVKVCDAVQHAHLNGIIHRDIKPSNILVLEESETPLPKVIDFGIAKAMSSQDQTDKVSITAYEQFIGTPAYMSPEQAGLNGLEIDSRTDIYSLGVLLYELLAGCLPFESREFSSNELRQTIREEKPSSPSTKFKMLGEKERLNIAHCRHIAPSKLQKALSGELARIVMTCLEKDREQRFETVGILANEIQQFLKGTPSTDLKHRLDRTFIIKTSFIVILVCAAIGMIVKHVSNRSEVLTNDDVITPDGIAAITINTINSE